MISFFISFFVIFESNFCKNLCCINSNSNQIFIIIKYGSIKSNKRSDLWLRSFRYWWWIWRFSKL